MSPLLSWLLILHVMTCVLLMPYLVVRLYGELTGRDLVLCCACACIPGVGLLPVALLVGLNIHRTIVIRRMWRECQDAGRIYRE